MANTKIQFKTGGGVVETVRVGNSEKEVEVAHSSYMDVVDRILVSIKNRLINDIENIPNTEENYNKNFEINWQVALNKQSI